MIEIQGKMVYESLEEVIEPNHTALMIIDMQNGLASLDGYTARHSKFSIAHQREILPGVQKMLAAAREMGICIVHVQVVFDKNGGSSSPAWLYMSSRLRDLGAYWGHSMGNDRRTSQEVLIDGTWEAEIIPELEPLPNEIVVKKHRNTAFVNTRMDQILKSNRIDSLVVTGTSTAGCVLATCLDALWNDYYTVVVSDCIADGFPERHEAGVAILREKFDMPSSDEVLGIWAKQRVGVTAA